MKVNEIVNPEILLGDPQAVIEEPLPRPETPGTNDDEQAVMDREARDRLLRDEIILENEEKRERGPEVGHNVFYNEVQKRLTSRLFLALGTEGTKKMVQKKHAYRNIKT